jgi:recombinational DNA repair ATPase RecF
MIWIHLDDLDLILEGTITRTRFLGKGVFEVGVDYSDTAPDYWRECLVDLLPQPNELE